MILSSFRSSAPILKIASSHRPGREHSTMPANPCFKTNINNHRSITYARLGIKTRIMIMSSAADVSTSATVGASASAANMAQVILTRESGKNGKLMKALEAKGVSCLEMPLIETSRGPDRDKLPEALKNEQYDWVCITSPEAASVFIEGWKSAGKPSVRVAVVGAGTGKILEATGEEVISPQFTPTVANAEHFGPELPFLPGGTKRVLYPASNKASSILQEGLLSRGFDVVRLNTYDTVPVTTIDENTMQAARQADVVAVASPSALRAWVQFAGADVASAVTVAAIGSTSARAAEKAGLTKIFYPEEPGLDTFVSTIVEALESTRNA